MQKNQNLEQEELSPTQISVEEANNKNSSEILERIKIHGTPFVRIKSDKGYALILGKYRITEHYKSKGDIDKILKEKDWDTLITLMLALLDLTKKNPDVLTME